MTERYVVGIDAGGTKTVGLLADESGNIVTKARGAGANLVVHGELAVEKVLYQLIEDGIALVQVLIITGKPGRFSPGPGQPSQPEISCRCVYECLQFCFMRKASRANSLPENHDSFLKNVLRIVRRSTVVQNKSCHLSPAGPYECNQTVFVPPSDRIQNAGVRAQD